MHPTLRWFSLVPLALLSACAGERIGVTNPALTLEVGFVPDAPRDSGRPDSPLRQYEMVPIPLAADFVRCGDMNCPVPESICISRASGPGGPPTVPPPPPPTVIYSCIPRPAACVGVADCNGWTGCSPQQNQCIASACFGGWPGPVQLSSIQSGGNHVGCGSY